MGRSILPSVETPNAGKTYQNFNVGKRANAISYRNSIEGRSQSRNIVFPNRSLTGSIYSNALAAAPGNLLKPLSIGQNRGKFNQLKSLLQSQERVQTSDDIAPMRNNKQVFFDPKNRLASYGHTGFD